MSNVLQIEIEVDDNGSVKVREFGKELDKAGEKGERSFKKADTALDSLGNRVNKTRGNVIALSTAFIGLATGAAVTGMLKLVHTASDLNETISKSRTIFKDQANDIEQWAGRAATAMGLSTQAAIDNAATMGNMFDQLGAGTKVAAETSKQMVQLSSDLASFHNVAGGAEEVLNAMMSAFRGEYDALQRYIPTINAAAVQHKALAMTGKDTAKELTNLEKAFAAQKIIMEDAGAAVGDFARTSEGLANQERILAANLADLKAMLGQELLPAVTDVVTGMNEWIKANKGLIEQKVPEVAEKIAESLKSIVAIYNSLPDGVVGAAGVGIIGRILTGSTPIAQAAAALVLLNRQLDAIGMSLESLPEKSASAWENIVNIWEVITGKRDWNTGGFGNLMDSGSMDGVLDFLDNTKGQLQKIREELLAWGKANEVASGSTKKTTKAVGQLSEAIRLLAYELKEAEAYEKNLEWIWGEQFSAAVMVEWDELDQKVKEVNNNVAIDTEQTTDAVYDLWMRAMNRVEAGIADAFYDVFTGQFDDIEDAFEGLLDSMLRMFAEWAAAATMYDIFGQGDGSASWGGLFSSLFGGSGGSGGIWGGAGGAGGSSGGIFDWIGSLFSIGSKGYELYTGESLMGQVYNFAVEALGSILSTAAGSAYSGMYAEITAAEVEAMIAAELASIGIGEGAGAAGGASAANAAWGGAVTAAVTAFFVGLQYVWEANTKPDANMTVALSAKISDAYDRLFDVEFLSVLGNQGFNEADAETEIYSLFDTVSDSFMHFERIWSILSKDSQETLKESLRGLDWDEFVLTIRAWAKAGGPLDVRGIFGDEGYKDWMKSGAEWDDSIPVTTEEGGDAFWEWFYKRIGIDVTGEGKYDTTGPAGNTTAVVWEIIHEYFEPFIGEAVQAMMDMDVYRVMSDEFQASVESLLTDEAWAGGVEAYFQTFSDNIDKLYEATEAYENFNNLIEGTTDQYTETNRATELATAATAAYVAALEAAGEEVSEEKIAEIAQSWARHYAKLADDLSAAAEKATALDQATAALTGQFEAYWQQMIKAGIDVEKLGNKTELLNEAIADLTETMQAAVWDEINKSVKSMMSEVGKAESSIDNLIGSFTAMWQALIQVNAATEDFALLQTMALEAMKYQMGLGEGFDRAGLIQERYGQWGMSYQEMIDAFAKMDLSELKEVADYLGIDWWVIAQDIAWMIDNIEEAGEAATKAGTDFSALRSQIESILFGVSGSFGDGSSASAIMKQITDLQSIPMSEQTGENLLAMSEKLVQWYNAAVAEATAAAREEQAAANLLIQVADRLESLVTQIDSTIRSIKYSGLNVTVPTQKAIEAQGDYAALLAAAQTGGTAEIQEYLGFTQTYLQQQQAAYKSSATYQDIYASVMSDMEAIKAKAEAGGYDAAILAELERGHEELHVDLSDIQATFSEFEGWILDALETVENLSLAISIDWDNWDGDMAEALEMLLALVEVYGWDHEYTLKFLAEVPMDIFANLDELATAAGWIADNSGGWNSSATINFLKNVAGNWEWENVDEILTSIGFVAAQAGGYTAEATISFISELMDRYGTELRDMPYWLDRIGLTDLEIADVMAALIVEAYGGNIPIEDIDEYLTDIGITDADIKRNIKIGLIYDMVSSGDLDFKDVSTYAYNQAYAAWIMDAGNEQAKSILEDLQALGSMWGLNNAYNLGATVNHYGGYNTDPDEWMNLWTKHGMDNRWAEGGVVSSPTLGWVGEAGYPEAIIPMMDGTSIPVKWVDGGSNGKPINLTVQIAGREFEGEVKAWADDVVVMRNKRGRATDTRRYYS